MFSPLPKASVPIEGYHNLSRRAHIITTITLLSLFLGCFFQTILLVNLAYHPDNSSLGAALLVIGFFESMLLLFNVFGLFVMISRLNLMLIHGISLGVNTLVLIIILMIGTFQHETPNATGETLKKLTAYFGLKVVFFGASQFGCAYITWLNCWVFRHLSGNAVRYSLMNDDEEEKDLQGAQVLEESPGSYVPPIYAASAREHPDVETAYNSNQRNSEHEDPQQEEESTMVGSDLDE